MPGTPTSNQGKDMMRCMEDVAGAIQRLPRFLDTADTQPGVAIDRLERLLLQGAFADALALCRTLRVSVPDEMLVPLIRRLDRRWNADEIGFSDLSFAFFQIRRLIDLLREPAISQISPDGPAKGKILLALAPAEEHSFGLQIVAAELALHGWQVDLHVDATAEGLCERLRDRTYDVVGLSVGHDGAMDGLADVITELRLASRNSGISVMLGGAALVEPVSRYEFLGADRICQTAAEAATWLAARQPRQIA